MQHCLSCNVCDLAQRDLRTVCTGYEHLFDLLNVLAKIASITDTYREALTPFDSRGQVLAANRRFDYILGATLGFPETNFMREAWDMYLVDDAGNKCRGKCDSPRDYLSYGAAGVAPADLYDLRLRSRQFQGVRACRRVRDLLLDEPSVRHIT